LGAGDDLRGGYIGVQVAALDQVTGLSGWCFVERINHDHWRGEQVTHRIGMAGSVAANLLPRLGHAAAGTSSTIPRCAAWSAHVVA
jgi:hypothetical protein